MFQNFKEDLLPILTTVKSVGFMISGGFDSGLLLYVVSKINLEEKLNLKFYVFTVPRHDDSLIHSSRIVDWINKTYNTQIKIMMTGDPDLHHSQQVWSGALSVISKCDILLLGDTTNPPHLNNGPVRNKVNDQRVSQPFFNYTKYDTVKLAIELNLVELMKLSHTCTESKLLRCNTCWQCQERAWAFEKNNFSDPGTM